MLGPLGLDRRAKLVPLRAVSRNPGRSGEEEHVESLPMPVELFTDAVEPNDGDAVIWRFMEFWKFSDLLRTSRLHFCRADLFEDEQEGLPPEEYVRLITPRLVTAEDVDDFIGWMKQSTESWYVSCWYLESDRPPGDEIWHKYDVAVRSTYRVLYSALDNLDVSDCGPPPCRPHIGLVRYGGGHLTGCNTQRFITTKRVCFAHEQELRAAIWCPEVATLYGTNRHFDGRNRPHPKPLTESKAPRFQRPRVDLRSLVTDVVVRPGSAGTRAETESVLAQTGYSVLVR